MQLPENVVFWIPRFRPTNPGQCLFPPPVTLLTCVSPCPPILTILFLTLLGVLLYAVGLKGWCSLDAYRWVLFLDTLALERSFPPWLFLLPRGGLSLRAGLPLSLSFLWGGLFAFQFYPDADWQRSLLVFVILSGVLRPCFYIWFVCWACPWATLFPNNVLTYWVSPLGRFPLRPLALGPLVGLLTRGFGGRWGMGTVLRFLISGAFTFGRTFSRILWTLL